MFATVLGIPSVGRAQTTKQTASASTSDIAGDVVKVGEYQSSADNLASNAATITEIRTSSQTGRQAATLYVHSIPVLTFVGQKPAATEETKVGVMGNNNSASPTKEATVGTSADISNQTNPSGNDPVERATVVAAKINQLIRGKVDASKITVSWFAEGKTAANTAKKQNSSSKGSLGDRYMIKVDNQELVEINSDTTSAQTTKDPAKDALQAANNLRRLIGNASPLKEVANVPLRLPKFPQEITIGPVRLAFKGVASWYGYDGSGNQTAAGERYNPEGMTAAHRSLPLGTKVRVTNTHNGRSVVVRINDRGPYVRGRIIDLSAAAARILGMMGSGVAPVHIEVLGR